MIRNFKFLFVVLLVLSAALFQNSDLIKFYGVKPDLFLAIIAVFLFFAGSFKEYFILSLAGIAVLKFMPGFDKESLILMGLALLIFILKKYFFQCSVGSILILITLSTALFYLLAAPRFIASNPTAFILEVVYNNLIGLIIYPLFIAIYEKKE